MVERQRALTGIKPTGTPHLGNFLGSIKPSIELSAAFDALYFVADYHALTTVHDAAQMRNLSHQVAATWIALGLDTDNATFYRQSDIPEIFECAWILSCFTPKGLLNRAHAYKAAVARNEELGRDLDAGISTGLYNYPVLMAADILLFSGNVVPVGQDQKQHIEIARDIADAFNREYGQQLLVLPQPKIDSAVATVPGIDGRKMSKSYDNVIPIFAEEKALRKTVMSIVTDSTPVEDPKDPETCNVFAIFSAIATPDARDELAARYRAGGLGYGTAKQELFELIWDTFAPARARYDELMNDTSQLDAMLVRGAESARGIAVERLKLLRTAVGID